MKNRKALEDAYNEISLLSSFGDLQIEENNGKKIKAKKDKKDDISLTKLKDVLDSLTSYEEPMLVDEEKNQLHNIELKQAPPPNKACPCNSKQRYKKCCAGSDALRSKEAIKMIEYYLKNGEQVK